MLAKNTAELKRDVGPAGRSGLPSCRSCCSSSQRGYRRRLSAASQASATSLVTQVAGMNSFIYVVQLDDFSRRRAHLWMEWYGGRYS